MKVIGAVKGETEFCSYMVEFSRSELLAVMETLCVNSKAADTAIVKGQGVLTETWDTITKCHELHRLDTKMAGVLAKLAEAKSSLEDVTEAVAAAKGVRKEKEQEKK